MRARKGKLKISFNSDMHHRHSIRLKKFDYSQEGMYFVTAGVDTRPTPTRLGDIMSAFKSITTTEYIKNVNENGGQPFEKRLWQRNYYEHVIRNNEELQTIREYILTNPAKWEQDQENPNNIGDMKSL